MILIKSVIKLNHFIYSTYRRRMYDAYNMYTIRDRNEDNGIVPFCNQKNLDGDTYVCRRGRWFRIGNKIRYNYYVCEDINSISEFVNGSAFSRFKM